MKLTKMWSARNLTFFCLVLAFGLARTAYGDNTVVINANATIAGANVCGPSGNALCTETFTGSFQWDNTTESVVANSGTDTTVGPLNSFAFSTASGLNVGGGGSFVGGIFPDPFNDIWIVDLGAVGTSDFQLLPGTYLLSTSIPSAPGQAQIFLRCNFQTAAMGPCPSDFPDAFNSNGFGFQITTSGTVTVSETPEPGSMLLLGTGLVGTGLIGGILRRRIRN